MKTASFKALIEEGKSRLDEIDNDILTTQTELDRLNQRMDDLNGEKIYLTELIPLWERRVNYDSVEEEQTVTDNILSVESQEDNEQEIGSYQGFKHGELQREITEIVSSRPQGVSDQEIMTIIKARTGKKTRLIAVSAVLGRLERRNIVRQIDNLWTIKMEDTNK